MEIIGGEKKASGVGYRGGLLSAYVRSMLLGFMTVHSE